MKKKKRANFLRVWLTNFGAMIPLNILNGTLLFMLAPCGLAMVGMTRVAIDMTKSHYYTSIIDYLVAIKKCWKQAIIAGMINLFATVFLGLSIWLYYSASGLGAKIGLCLSCVGMAVFSFMKYYVWPQIVLIQLPLGKIYKNSYLFAFMNLKKNILIGFISLVCYASAVVVLLYIPYPIISVGFILLCGWFFPGFKQLLVEWHAYPFIKKHMIDVYYEGQATAYSEAEERGGTDCV